MQSSKNLNSGLMSIAEEVVVGVFHLFWGSSLAILLSAICGIVVARLLGPELYGVYSLSLVVANILMLFTNFGIGAALTRYIALYMSRGENRCVQQLLWKSLVFSFATALTTSLVGYIFAEPLATLLINRPGMASIVRITMVFVAAYPLTAVIGSALIGFGDMKRYATIDVVRQALRLVLNPLMIVLGFGVLGAVVGNVVAYLAGCFVSLALLFWHYKRVKVPSNGGGDCVGIRTALTYGLPLYLTGVLQSLTGTLQGIILAHFVADYFIGNFRAAMNLATVLTIVAAPIATALFPVFSKLSGDDAKAVLKYSIKYSSAVVIPASAFVAITSRDLAYIIYGERYSHAPLYLSLYTITFLYTAVGSAVLSSFFSGVGDTKINLYASIIQTASFIPLALTLTYVLQVEGLIAAIIIASGIATMYCLQIAVKRYGAEIDFKSSARICLASLIAIAPVTPFALYTLLPRILNIIVAAVLYLIAYLSAALILKALTREDIEIALRALSRIRIAKPLVRLISDYIDKIMKLVD